MSYTDNGNGTITDNVTGLMWQQGENPTTYNWYQASGTYNATSNPSSQNVCGSLTLGGYSDWRLPTKKELITIVDYSIPYPGPTINTTYFPNAYADGYWSSTTYSFNTGSAWYMIFYSGSIYYRIKYVSDYGMSYPNYVLCVRGGQSGSLCNLVISPSSQTFKSKGGTGPVTVTASSSSCSWTASEGLSWVSITSGSIGPSSGTVTYSVSKNTTKSTRTGNMTIADKTFTITQKK